MQLLIGDFFFVLLALAWLALGVAEKSTLNTSVSQNLLGRLEAQYPSCCLLIWLNIDVSLL